MSSSQLIGNDISIDSKIYLTDDQLFDMKSLHSPKSITVSNIDSLTHIIGKKNVFTLTNVETEKSIEVSAPEIAMTMSNQGDINIDVKEKLFGTYFTITTNSRS